VFNTLKSHESTFTKKYSFVKKSQLAITSSNFVYQGERTTLDDRVLISYDSKLAAVFDGRNGTKVAHKLFTDFENLLNSKLTAPINEDKIALGIKDTIHDIDQEILKDKTLGIVGSTASISYILPNLADYRKSSLITANVGNSRVVLSQSKIAVDLTVDHRPEDPEERARVEAAGGIVAIAMGEWRIMGTLNVARSIG
jgi:serine/threonine protein phosphatase PrpC